MLNHELKQEEAVITPPLDRNLELFTERQQIANTIKGLEARKKIIDEDIKSAIVESGESFGNEREYLTVTPEERTTFDYKSAILSGVLTAQQAEPFMKRTVFGKLVVKKVEPSATPLDPATAEGSAMRDRIANASKGLLA